jgi:hypothetical protein
MLGNPLESARAKINRAKYHLGQLNDEIQSAENAKKYPILFRHELQTNELVINALMPRDLFIHYSIVAGEIIGHARSALEHAVWEMVPSPDPGGTGFPVFRLETKAERIKPKDRYYDRDGVRKIDGINPKAAAIIKAEQPFGPNYQTNLLHILNELWNRDKHRLLNTCIAYPQAMQLMYVGADKKLISDRQILLPANIKDSTELFREPHPGADVQVMAEVDTRGVIFDGGLVDGKPVPQFLLKLVEFSDRIIDALAMTI